MQLFNLSLNSGVIPYDWKKSLIVLIPQNSDLVALGKPAIVPSHYCQLSAKYWNNMSSHYTFCAITH